MRRGARPERRLPRPASLFAAALLALAATPADADPGRKALERADAAWERRAEGCDEAGRVTSQLAAETVEAYQQAVDAEPGALAPRWKLARALYFAADLGAGEPGEPLRLLERATRVSDQALDLLAERLGVSGRLESFTPVRLARGLEPHEVADAAGAFFWSAVVWGAWSQHHGMIEAVRAGIADRLYQGALAVIALDPTFEEGGAHRLLARIHAQVPRIPFFSGWVDPGLAVPAAERAVALAPRHPANRFLLALTLLDVAPARRGEALRLLEEVAAAEPRPDQRAEDLAIRRSARERLARENGFTRDVAAGP